ncbi:MAG: bifunctional phosphopantothenoylcysteine decarboxylase/phosphopantothenate--cysteine ligase CoaBC [Ruminococcus sp.]|nr:bifunctional phosphopantothenoylcysteine decarboxylase/phosphopantothenate--cysteine ligase CoaBC [Ruminococcus sp.]
MLRGKTVIVAVTGSIAAYKMADCVHRFTKLHANVHVLMTQNACQFINPVTFETLTNNKCLIDTFDRSFQYSVEHVSLATKADIALIAPASANVIGKLANGIADDMLTTTIMACTCQKLIAPAMNHNMLHNPIVEDNIKKLKRYGYEIIEPEHGMLANGDVGDGRLPDSELLVKWVLQKIAKPKDLSGLKILVSAGATCEQIDSVRYITNHSTGKMGIALAERASMRGAQVTLVAAQCSVKMPEFVKIQNVESAKQMYNEIMAIKDDFDIIIMAAAVADYTPKEVSQSKIKKSDEELTIELKRTDDILKAIGESKSDEQIICGFSMETENLYENSKKKLESKNCDLICANSLNIIGAGFGADTNVITMITKTQTQQLSRMSKADAADIILDKILEIKSEKSNEKN